MKASINARLKAIESKIESVAGCPPLAVILEDSLYHCHGLPDMTEAEYKAYCEPWARIDIPSIVLKLL